MDDEEQALAYANADFDAPHNHFIQLLTQKLGNALPEKGKAIDLGCGAADISIRFANAYPDYSIDAFDGAKSMLAEGKLAIDKHHLAKRINLVETMIDEFTLNHIQAELIFSNSLLHHLHNPMLLWKCIKQAKGNPCVFIMDLMRPESEQELDYLVKEYSSNEPEILQRDFSNSLQAAFTEEEVRLQLLDAGLTHLQLEVISDRHLIIFSNQ
jgi:ubiquinone/menaquinone biosynthesis C-methylase UbiE